MLELTDIFRAQARYGISSNASTVDAMPYATYLLGCRRLLTDKTPADFIRSFRLQEAEKRLRTTSKTVQEIMADCGFKNKAHFYREFAKLYHATPKEYRMTVSNTGEQDPQK